MNCYVCGKPLTGATARCGDALLHYPDCYDALASWFRDPPEIDVMLRLAPDGDAATPPSS